MTISSSAPAPTPHVGSKTPFRAFEPTEFRMWPAWDRMSSILTSNGGSFGVSGARGAGKSWLMQQAIDHVRLNGGIGLWYPSPSEYEPAAFLASLSNSLAKEVEHRYGDEHRPATPLAHAVPLLIAALLGLATFVVLIRVSAIGWAAPEAAAAGLAATVVSLLVAHWASTLRRVRNPRKQLLREARDLRERTRFATTERQNTAFGAEGGSGLTVQMSSSREQELAERPATLSSLINDFRDLAQNAAVVAGYVLVAIDELDKLEDTDEVNSLLRGIKGIFDIPHVFFLVSISDEAARSLNLSSLRERDNFNSCFYGVVHAQPATPDQVAELLRDRSGTPRDAALALGVLAGGNPREVVRLAELAGAATTVGEAVMMALEEQALRLRRDVVTAAGPAAAVDTDARVGVYQLLPNEAFDSPREFLELAGAALKESAWDPSWRTPAWEEHFGEQWRRLLVRLAVAAELARAESLVQDPALGLRLQDVIVATSQSAYIGRTVLDKQLRLDTPDARMGAGQARERLDELARRYEQVRGASEPGPERTAELDGVVAEVRTLARDAELDSAGIVKYLEDSRAGNRVVGLGVVQATADPKTLPSLLLALNAQRSVYEQYHVLLALESLRSGLTPEVRDQVRHRLVAASEKWPPDVARQELFDRLVASLTPTVKS